MSETPEATSGTILIADDDRFVKKLLQLILDREGYEVLTAENGAQALEIAAAETPGLIILDIEMPGLDGYATCRALSDDPTTQNIPVIFLSSRREVSAKIAGLELGAVDYVAKPFDPREFLARVRASLRSARTPSSRQSAIRPGDGERQLARQMRQTLLTQVPPVEPEGLDVGTAIARGTAPTGDFFSFVERRGQLLVAFGEVTGDDLPAIAAAHQLQLFFHCANLTLDDPATAARRAEQFFRHCCRTDLGLALTLIGWSASQGGSVRIGGAGGPAPLMLRAGKQPRMIPVGGQPIAAGSAEPASGEEAVSLALEPGDGLLLYPRPLLDDNDGAYGLARLHAALAGAADLPAPAMVRRLAEDISGSGLSTDRDTTLVALRRSAS